VITAIIVEDERFMREELQKTVPWKRLGMELVGAAEDGIEGERLIKEAEPDLVVTDIRLPGQDGLAMLSRSPVAYAIVISGYSDFPYMREAIRLGVYDYLRKPIDDRELERTLVELADRIRRDEQDLRFLRARKGRDEALVALPRSTGHLTVDGAIAFIRENHQRPIGLKEAAEELRVSEGHLSRLFKEVTGVNYLHYLNAFRINRAAVMLTDPRLSVSEISEACGFPNPGYFAKLFKRFSDRTPSQYREGPAQGGARR
jgi:two-component system response regulator YesN